MRTFVKGEGPDRKFVMIEVQGRRMAVINGRADGSKKRTEKELASEADAAKAAERMAQEAIARGYAEQKSSARPAVAVAKTPQKEEEAIYSLDEAEEPIADAAPVLPRMTAPPAGAAEKPSKPKKKKKRKKQSGEKPDWLFLVGISSLSVVLVGLVGYFVWNTFLKPATLVGVWQGSRLDYEISKMPTKQDYHMALDAQHNVSLVLQKEIEFKGTYSADKNHLHLKVANTKDPDDKEEMDYTFKLSSSELDLFDSQGKKIVELIRLNEAPKLGAAAPAAAPPPGGGELPKADAGLASQDFSVKDGSFACKYPAGWTPQSGASGDNTFAWASFEKDSAKIKIEADIAGSLMTGIAHPHGDTEGGEAPVLTAHNLNKKKVAENFEKYVEGDPQTFTSEGLGEGRIVEFKASAGGLFGGTIHGYRATLLSNDRRVGILCQCPEKEWPKDKPTFFAVIHSLHR